MPGSFRMAAARSRMDDANENFAAPTLNHQRNHTRKEQTYAMEK
jgi:hypothetical protein